MNTIVPKNFSQRIGLVGLLTAYFAPATVAGTKDKTYSSHNLHPQRFLDPLGKDVFENQQL